MRRNVYLRASGQKIWPHYSLRRRGFPSTGE